ncbi:hypothetical protein ND00_22570 [Clostridium sp. L74]|nr:hypothetical protein ND00_22570 [Clostridium sp. L74]
MIFIYLILLKKKEGLRDILLAIILKLWLGVSLITFINNKL